MGDGGWRWWFRTRCQMIAHAEDVPGLGLHIKLCRRRRWHRGECA